MNGRFGSKELYMAFMNEFLESETSSMHSLLADVSSTGGSGAGPEFDGRVDLGLELALLHDTLFDVLPTLGKVVRCACSHHFDTRSCT